MMMTFKFPLKESDLLTFLTQYNALIGTQPTMYGLTADQSNALDALVQAYKTALMACEPTVRSQTAVVTKNEARTAVKTMAYNLAMIVAGAPSVTAAEKLQLGIRPRKARTPVPAPGSSPLLDVVNVDGRSVTVGLHAYSGRGRLKGTLGAGVFSFVGATPPTDAAGWKFETLVSEKKVTLFFAGSTATTVWVTASWYASKGQTGAACQPVSINLPAAGALPTERTLRVAA